MRVLQILFTGFIVLVLIGAALFFGAREGMLWWASQSVRASLEELARSETKGTFAQQCQRSVGSSVFSAAALEYQLRFLSDSEYALEVVCDTSQKAPVLIARKNLPFLVTKVSGSSGILPKSERSGIRLTVFAREFALIKKYIGEVPDFLVRERAVVVAEGVVLAETDPLELGIGPATSCEGYGFVCCDGQTQMGSGESLTGAQNCPTSCFSSCITRPVLLSFTTSPFINPQNRSLTVTSGGTVSFHYVADAGQSSELNALLDFGDGSEEQLQGTTGSIDHVYTCASSSCQYTAKLKLTDNWGVSSLSGKLETVAVNVSGGV